MLSDDKKSVTQPILSANISAINLAVELLLMSPRKMADFIVRLPPA